MENQTDIVQIKQIDSVAAIINRNLATLERGSALAIENLKAVQEMEINTDEDKQQAIEILAKVKNVFDKVQTSRKEATVPIDEIKSWLMSYERPIDPEGKDNEFSRAKAVINAYDQAKLDAKKKAEVEAEMVRKVNVYKAELKASVAKSLADMVAGLKKTLIQQMAAWEAKITLENHAEMTERLNHAKQPDIKQEKYDACFHENFRKSYLLNDQLTKEYIESLKKEFPYAKFDSEYKAIAVEIVNSYKEKMPSIKAKLEEIKGNAEKEAQRLKQVEEEALKEAQLVDKQRDEAVKDIDSTKDMETVEAEFIKQGSTQDLEAGPSKKEASFENDAMWLKPLQEVIAHVAINGMTIRKKNGEYIDSISWWLKKFEALGKEVNGIKLVDVAKTIVKQK